MRTVKKYTWLTLAVNFILALLKVVMGIIGNSGAVLADGIHSFSDLSTDLAIIIGIHFWTRPADSDHPYGHRKIETIIVLFIGLVLLFVAGRIIWSSITNWNEKVIPGMIAFWAALISIIVKEVMYQITYHIGNKCDSESLKANALHQRSDALSSVPAALAVLVVIIFPNFYYADKIGAIVVAIIIIYAAFKLIFTSGNKLADSGASKETIIKIEQIINKYPQIKNHHKLRTRYSGNILIIDFHIQVNPQMSVQEGHQIATDLKKELLQTDLKIGEAIIHIEPYY